MDQPHDPSIGRLAEGARLVVARHLDPEPVRRPHAANRDERIPAADEVGPPGQHRDRQVATRMRIRRSNGPGAEGDSEQGEGKDRPTHMRSLLQSWCK
jgi:hypothetical protein